MTVSHLGQRASGGRLRRCQYALLKCLRYRQRRTFHEAYHSHFFTSLAVTLLVVVTLYLLYWLTLTTERILDRLLRFVLPQAVYVVGLGLVLCVVLVFLVGLPMHPWARAKSFPGSRN